MKNQIYQTFLLLFLLSCTSQKNSENFINATKGRYLFNANEVIEIYFKNSEMFAKWRGNNSIELLKVNDSSFYMKELNEKLLFISKPKIHILLEPKTEHKGTVYEFRKMAPNEKTPSEYFEAKKYDEALNAFLAIKEQDSLNPTIKQYKLNSTGYRYLRDNKFEEAIEIFKINTQLYPKSSNTYDSLADAYLQSKDTVKAIENYKKALSINPENRSSKRMLERITKK